MRSIALIVVACACVTRVSAQDDSTHIDPLRVGAIAGATLGGFVVGHGILNDLWWKGERVPFHINSAQDYTYALNADKYGHATFAYMASTVYGDLMRWCGLDSTSAAWWGFGVAMTYQTYIEVRDGYSRDYGFSWGDIGANTLGAALPVAQHYIPALRAFDLQISFWPSDAFRQGAYNAIIDDYTSTTHWLAMNVHDLAPRSVQQYLPPWLGIAIGHSVRNLDGRGGGEHVVVLSLDWQLHRIPNLPSWLRDIARVLHLYHLPAPAVQILPNVVWYGLRF